MHPKVRSPAFCCSHAAHSLHSTSHRAATCPPPTARPWPAPTPTSPHPYLTPPHPPTHHHHKPPCTAPSWPPLRSYTCCRVMVLCCCETAACPAASLWLSMWESSTRPGAGQNGTLVPVSGAPAAGRLPVNHWPLPSPPVTANTLAKPLLPTPNPQPRAAPPALTGARRCGWAALTSSITRPLSGRRQTQAAMTSFTSTCVPVLGWAAG